MWVAKNLVVGYSRYYNYVLWAYFIAFLIFVKKKKKGNLYSSATEYTVVCLPTTYQYEMVTAQGNVYFIF